MKKVAIVLSTYNGEQFIKQQLDSLVHQHVDSNKVNVHIYCRDDGSKDTTTKIIEMYMEKYTNISIVCDSGNNLGVKLSFFSLLQQVSADYYFFCDQDDIWNPNKISMFLTNFSQLDNNKPAGVYSDLNLVDANGDLLGITMMQANRWENEKRNFLFFFFHLRVTGAAFAINRVARDKLITVSNADFSKVRMHDGIAALLIASYDNLSFINKPMVNYRQHDKNVLGAITEKKPLNDIGFRKATMHQYFNDLQLLEKMICNEDIPFKNSRALNAVLDFNGQSNRLGYWLSIVNNFNAVWRKVELKRLVFFAFLYK